MPGFIALRFVQIFATLAISTAGTRAEVIFTEPFDYTNGPLPVVSAGRWVYTSGSPTNTLEVSDGKVSIEDTDAEDLASQLPGGPFPASTNVALYWSFRLIMTKLPSGTGDYFIHLSGFANRARLFAVTNGASANMLRLGVANGASAVSAIFPRDLPAFSEAVVVLGYSPGTAQTTLWIDPGSEDDASVTATDTASTGSISRIALRQDSNIGKLYLDDLRIGTAFEDVLASAMPTRPTITQHPESKTVTAGQSASFTARAAGTTPMSYQWIFEGLPLAWATNATLGLMGVHTNQAGSYWLVASNLGGVSESAAAVLEVRPAPVWDGELKVLTWNVKGNNVTNLSVQSPQVEAIRRVVTHLAPDVITFNEIPNNFLWEMTNWVAAFLPGWYLATNSGTDSFIRSVIASRFQILSSRKHFDGTSLAPYGTGGFTRDLFQARVRVPGFAEPVDVFTTHLKATTSSPQADADKRGAEAMVISNFLANVYLPTNRGAAYLLTGDLNEDVLRPDSNRYTSKRPIEHLANPETGLVLTTPLNPVTLADFTLSIQSTLNVRFDYVLPCASLADGIVSSQVFRSDMLDGTPNALVLSQDSRTASDHLPVMVGFRSPNWPVLPLIVNGPVKLLSWESSPGEVYRVLSTTNLAAPLQDWNVETANLQATNYISSLVLTSTTPVGFFKVELSSPEK